MPNKKVAVIANDYLKDHPSEAAFQGKFGEDLPDVLNKSHRMLAVASLIDLASERIIRYLSETYGVNINAVTFQYFKEPEGAEYIGRSILIREDLIERPPLKRRPSNLTF